MVRKTRVTHLKEQIELKKMELMDAAGRYGIDSHKVADVWQQSVALQQQLDIELNRQKGPISYKAVTANCGNDAMGERACGAIGDEVVKNSPDFIVINCQEVHFKKTLKQLQESLPEGYRVTLVSKMATHTKPSTQFNADTGIATYVIHRDDVQVKAVLTTEARISPNRLGKDRRGYNKGGLITNLEITKGEQNISVQTVSGHLDATSAAKRSRDWHKLNQEMAKANESVAENTANSWEKLVKSCPTLTISGYDANTRNVLTPKGAVNSWDNAAQSTDLVAFRQSPLGGHLFSDPSTYKPDHANITQNPSKKRLGYSEGGMLDFVSISDGSRSNEKVNTGITKVGPEKGSKRDHDVLMSPVITVPPTAKDEFAQVRDHIAARLERAAPRLAAQIRQLPESIENKELLLNVHQDFLAPNGLLNQMVALHAKKMAAVQSESLNDTQAKHFSNQWFPKQAWFGSLNIQNLEQQMPLIRQRMNSENALIEGLTHFDKNPKAMKKEFEAMKQNVIHAAGQANPTMAAQLNSLPFNQTNWAMLHQANAALLETPHQQATPPAKPNPAHKSHYQQMAMKPGQLSNAHDPANVDAKTLQTQRDMRNKTHASRDGAQTPQPIVGSYKPK